DLAITRVGLDNPQSAIMLLLALDAAGESYRVLVNLNIDVAVAQHGLGGKTLDDLLLHFRSGQISRFGLLTRRRSFLPRRPVFWKCRRSGRRRRLLGQHCACREQNQSKKYVLHRTSLFLLPCSSCAWIGFDAGEGVGFTQRLTLQAGLATCFLLH